MIVMIMVVFSLLITKSLLCVYLPQGGKFFTLKCKYLKFLLSVYYYERHNNKIQEIGPYNELLKKLLNIVRWYRTRNWKSELKLLLVVGLKMIWKLAAFLQFLNLLGSCLFTPIHLFYIQVLIPDITGLGKTKLSCNIL